jgi:hypothetical protein
LLETEAEWLAATTPGELLEYLWQPHGAARSRAGRRKLRLFACACCRRVWHLLPDDGVRQALVTCERYADGLAGETERRQVRSEMHARMHALADREEFLPLSFAIGSVWYTAQATAYQGAYGAHIHASNARMHEVIQTLGGHLPVHQNRIKAGAVIGAEWRQQCQFLHDIFDNPFRPVTIDPRWLAWNDETIPRLARAIYDERAFDQLPILADALEDAGCTDAELLTHCRELSEHVPGCWVVDAFLVQPGAGP